MITASVGVPAAPATRAQVHIRGLSALPTGATATLYYSTPPIEVMPIYSQGGLIIFEFEIEGPNVTVRGTDGTDYVITAGGDCYVGINTRQVKYDPNVTGAVQVFVTKQAVRAQLTAVPGGTATDFVLPEGNVAGVDAQANEAVWNTTPFTQWMVNFVLNLT